MTAATHTLLTVTGAVPGGDVTAFVDEAGVVRAAGFGPADEVAARLLTGALAELAGRVRTPAGAGHPVARALSAYADGDAAALDRVPVDQPGTVLSQAVWSALRAIAPGSPATYAELAAAAGAPRAVRAAASACARNRIAPFVPCHRAIRTGGGLGGYAYGLPVKEALLAWEAANA